MNLAGDATAPSIVCFGSFVFDLATGELSRQGRRIALQDQPARVLTLFVTRAGRLVTRDEVREALWPKDTFVEFEAAIAVAINKIRRALGDSATNPRFIETIPKHGYRFLADVHPVLAPPPEALRAVHRSWRFRPSLAWMLVVGAFVVAAVSGAVRWTHPTSNTGTTPVSLTVMPFRVDGGGLRENVGVDLAEAIAKRIGPLRGVHVAPWIRRSTVAGSDPAAPARRLNVDAVLEGTLRVSGDRVDVAIELVRAEDGSRLWQEHFDLAQAEISSIENRVAEHLANRLHLSLTDTQRVRLARRSTANIVRLFAWEHGGGDHDAWRMALIR